MEKHITPVWYVVRCGRGSARLTFSEFPFRQRDFVETRGRRSSAIIMKPATRSAFLGAVRARRQPSCAIADAYASTTTVKLAMIAYETGAKITWDAASEQIAGNAGAAKPLKRDYRAPWQHPYRV